MVTFEQETKIPRMSESQPTRWNHYLSFFWGGAFLANAIPHFVMGVTGHPFQSPFAHPPGEGLSPALVNVLWGFFNLVIGYLLLAKVDADIAQGKLHDLP